MNGEGKKKLAEMTDVELVSFLLDAPGDFLMDDSSTVDFVYWVENS